MPLAGENRVRSSASTASKWKIETILTETRHEYHSDRRIRRYATNAMLFVLLRFAGGEVALVIIIIILFF